MSLESTLRFLLSNSLTFDETLHPESQAFHNTHLITYLVGFWTRFYYATKSLDTSLERLSDLLEEIVDISQSHLYCAWVIDELTWSTDLADRLLSGYQVVLTDIQSYRCTITATQVTQWFQAYKQIKAGNARILALATALDSFIQQEDNEGVRTIVSKCVDKVPELYGTVKSITHALIHTTDDLSDPNFE